MSARRIVVGGVIGGFGAAGLGSVGTGVSLLASGRELGEADAWLVAFVAALAFSFGGAVGSARALVRRHFARDRAQKGT